MDPVPQHVGALLTPTGQYTKHPGAGNYFSLHLHLLTRRWQQILCKSNLKNTSLVLNITFSLTLMLFIHQKQLFHSSECKQFISPHTHRLAFDCFQANHFKLYQTHTVYSLFPSVLFFKGQSGFYENIKRKTNDILEKVKFTGDWLTLQLSTHVTRFVIVVWSLVYWEMHLELWEWCFWSFL